MSPTSITFGVALAVGGTLAVCQSSDRIDALERRVATLEASLAGSRLGTESPSSIIEELQVRHLSIVDPDGTERIWLRTYPNDEPSIALLDNQGRRRLELYVRDDGGPSIHLHDAAQKIRVQLECPADGEAGIGIWGKGPLNETSHAGLWIWEDQTIAFGGGLRSASEGTFQIMTDAEGATTLTLRTPTGLRTFQAPEQ